MAKTDRIFGQRPGHHRRNPRQSQTVRRPILHRAFQRLVARREPPAAIRRGGGLPDSASFLAKAFFEPGGYAQTQGNPGSLVQSGRFIFPGRTPFAFYVQYAGENTLDGGSYLLGESSLAMGIDFPKLWHFFDLTYEITEWQNAWYINSVFLEGHDQRRLRARPLGRRPARFQRRRRRPQPDAAHRLGAALSAATSRSGCASW